MKTNFVAGLNAILSEEHKDVISKTPFAWFLELQDNLKMKTFSMILQVREDLTAMKAIRRKDNVESVSRAKPVELPTPVTVQILVDSYLIFVILYYLVFL